MGRTARAKVLEKENSKDFDQETQEKRESTKDNQQLSARLDL